jgi:hypothetical protein
VIRHLKILEYALLSLTRRKARNVAVAAAFTLTVAILGSILVLTSALEDEAHRILGDGPDLVVQRLAAGRHELIPLEYGDVIAGIAGVRNVRPRFWGYYYDALTESNYTVTGRGRDRGDLKLLSGRLPEESWECAVGAGVAALRHVSVGEDLILVNGRGTGVSLEVTGTFDASSALVTNDLVVMTDEGAADFFAFPAGKATDFVVEVPRRSETDTVAAKIKKKLPDSRPITRDEILRTWKAAFSWRSGMMLAAFAGALLAFAIIAWDRAAGVSAEEKREIGILKAVGWDTGDVLALKFWEGLSLSGVSLLGGIILAYVNVSWFGGGPLASIMRGWSVLFPAFDLSPRLQARELLFIGVATVAPYVTAVIIPAWKSAASDPEEAIRR